MSDYRDAEWPTCPPAYCINCGFVGATLHVNGIGPYCGKCAEHAGPPHYYGEGEAPRPAFDDFVLSTAMRRIIKAVNDGESWQVVAKAVNAVERLLNLRKEGER